MGIVNATGDSFSEKTDSAPETAVSRGCALASGGADILDIGGESTRPGAAPVDPDIEISRVIPVLAVLKKRLPQMVFSIDTRHPEVAEAALAAGAHIINDVSMLREPGMAEVVAKYHAGLIIGHSRADSAVMQNSGYCDYPDGVGSTVAAELKCAEKRALDGGVAEKNIMLDPGIGFSKTAGQCWELLRDLTVIDCPEKLVLGVSRKSFLGELTGESYPRCRIGETLAVELELAALRVGIIRTHAVRELCHAVIAATHYRRLKEL